MLSNEPEKGGARGELFSAELALEGGCTRGGYAGKAGYLLLGYQQVLNLGGEAAHWAARAHFFRRSIRRAAQEGEATIFRLWLQIGGLKAWPKKSNVTKCCKKIWGGLA